MTDHRWVDDIFSQKDAAKQVREQERAYVLEQRRQFQAGCDAFFDTIKEQVGAAVDAFNARLKSRSSEAESPISASSGDGSFHLAHPRCELRVSLDREKEMVRADGLNLPSKGFQVRHESGNWSEWELREVTSPHGQTTIAVRNIPKELVGEMFDRVAR